MAYSDWNLEAAEELGYEREIENETSRRLSFGTCSHCGKAPAVRLPLRHCQKCADELFHLPPGSQERKDWFNK